MKKIIVFCLSVLSTFMIFANDYKIELDNRECFGTVARAMVNDDNLNIRLKPTTNSIKVGKLNKGDIVTIKGYSDKKETIDNFEGYWLKIQVEENDVIKDYAGDNFGCFGWVFSKYIDIDPKIEVSKLAVKKVNPATENNCMYIDLEIDRQGEKSIVHIYPDKLGNQYFFVWSDDAIDFMFSDPVGTFKWNPETNEITHITDMGYICESAWCLVSDDGKLFFQDYGTSPGVRAFAIYDVETKKYLFGGSYLRDLEYDGKSIVIVEECSRWRINNNRVSDESLKRSKEYKKTLQAKDLESRNVVVRYKLNLADFTREYLDCTTVVEQ